MVFSDIVEAADNLTPDEQLALVEILRRRIAERNRESLLQDIVAAREEFSQEKKAPVSVDEIMDEIQS